MLPKIAKSKKLIYLDNAATTYLKPEVLKAMRPYLSEKYGNPSSLYSIGRQAQAAIEDARQSIAAVLECRPEELVFTAGGTESINAAIFGVVRKHQLAMRSNPKLPQPHIISSAIEHHAVLKSLEALAAEGAEITLVPVDKEGFVYPKDIIAAAKPNTILASVMYASNETGTVEPIAEISKVLRKLNAERARKRLPEIIFHTDACQAGGVLKLSVNKLGVDMLSLNASKMYGPKQVGLLYLRQGLRITPTIYGGGQEHGLRSGTENVSGIVGFAAALSLAEKQRLKENARLRSLRSYFYKKIKASIPDFVLNGPALESDSQQHPTRLPNNLNISMRNIEGEALMLYLDAYNVCVSTGSACASTSSDPSHVILALGRPAEYILGSMRFTLGAASSKKDLDYVIKVMPGIVSELRRVSRELRN